MQIVPEVHDLVWQGFIEDLGLCPLRHARGSWTFERVCSTVLEYARRSGAPLLFPKQDELVEVSVTQGHPLQFMAKGLAVRIDRTGERLKLSLSITSAIAKPVSAAWACACVILHHPYLKPFYHVPALHT